MTTYTKFLPLAFLFITAMLFLPSCSPGPGIDGSSEKSFKTSYQTLKKGLSAPDTVKLTAAIKVLAVSMLSHKMFDNDAGTKPSVNNQLRQQLNGKTYQAIITMAEDTLKAVKKSEIASLQTEITAAQADARQRRAPYDALKKQLDIIQGHFIKMDLVKGVPTAYFEFKNVSNNELDHFSLKAAIRAISTNKVALSSGSSFGGVKTLRKNDTLMMIETISDFNKGETPEIPWKTISYPVTDLSKYNMYADAYADELKIDDKDIDLSTAKWSSDDEATYQQKLKDLQTKLKEAQDRREDLNNL